MNLFFQKFLIISVCGTGVLYGAGTLYNIFFVGHVTLEELPGIQLALTLYSTGIIVSAFMTLFYNNIGKNIYLLLVSVNLVAAVSMNSMSKLDLVTNELSHKLFYSCYLFNSLQFMINQFYINLMLYKEVPIQYLDITRTVLVMLSVGIPLLIIFYLTRPGVRKLYSK